MNRYAISPDASRDGASIDVPFAIPTIDGGRLDQHQRFPPPGPQPSQQEPKQPVSWAKTPMRAREDAELVAQGKSLEQEVCPCRLRCSDRSTRPEAAAHRW